MNIALAKPWQEFVADMVETGRFASPSAAVEEGLRLVAAREERVAWLRAKVQASIAEGGDISEDELDRSIETELENLRREGL